MPCLLQVLERLPVVAVSVKKPRLVAVKAAEDGNDEDSVSSPQSRQAEEQEWLLEVDITRLRAARGGAGGGASASHTARPRVYAPRFPKVSKKALYDGFNYFGPDCEMDRAECCDCLCAGQGGGLVCHRRRRWHA